jgi:hypothetical protein
MIPVEKIRWRSALEDLCGFVRRYSKSPPVYCDVKIIKTEVENPQPGLEIAGGLQAREGLKVIREYLASRT